MSQLEEFPMIENRPGGSASPPRGTAFDVAFGAIVILASFFSAYTTYVGFSFDLPVMLALILSVIIGLGLLAINFRIREARRDSSGLGRPLVAFTFVFIFSFVSNTNAIYTSFIQKDIVGDTQEKAFEIFQSGVTQVENAVKSTTQYRAYESRQEKMDLARENLKRQITDPRNPGLGILAQNHLAEITRLLEARLTPLRAPREGARMAEFEVYAQRLDDLIQKQIERLNEKDASRAIELLTAEMRKLVSSHEDELNNGDYSSEYTDDMKRELFQYSDQASRFLGQELEVEPVNNTADATGSFQYTWRNFADGINPSAIVLSILLGAMLDLLAPVLAILLYRPQGEF